MQRSNLQSFCRTCLKHLGNTVTIHHINQTPYFAKLLIICTSTNVEDDGTDAIYPQKLCGKCHDTLEQFQVFREMVQQSAEVLRKIIKEDGTDEEPIAGASETNCLNEYHELIADIAEHSMISPETESFVDPLLQTHSESNIECDIPIKRRKQKSINWSFVKQFENHIEVEKAIKEENIWSLNYSNQTTEGQKRFFRCNKVKKRGVQCSAKMYLLYDSTSEAVFMYRADAEHDHESKNLSSWSVMGDDVKLEIKKLFERNIKPRFIINNLARIDGIQMPKICQIRSYVRDLRRARYAEYNEISTKCEKFKVNIELETNDDSSVGEESLHQSDKNPNEVIPHKKRKKEPLQISWAFVKTFKNYSEAEEFLKEENSWSIEYSHNTREGQKIYFRCNKFKKRGQCSAKVYLLLDPASDSVSMHRAETIHDHENKNRNSTYGLSENVKLEINKLFYLDMRPKDIIDCLSRIKGIKVPKISQIRNYLRDLREEIHHASILPESNTNSIGVAHLRLNKKNKKRKFSNDDNENETSSVEVKGVVNPESGIIETIREKKWKPIPWTFFRKCVNMNEAEEVLKAENTWSVDYNRDTEEGHKTFYRCNKVKRRAIQCSAKLYLLFDNTTATVSIFRADAEHDHDQKELHSSYGLGENVKLEIQKLFELNMRPRAIFEKLAQIEGIKVPKMSQVRNYVSILRGRTFVYLNESSISAEKAYHTEFSEPISNSCKSITQENLETESINSANKVLLHREEYFQ